MYDFKIKIILCKEMGVENNGEKLYNIAETPRI
jgi:hypothetical protein